ncbi:hypothetical protein AAY51_13120 [Vibrio parahaemolyticus]|nr:hypothetical protein AAY51_13120 [Vibrio parahaemolyticus]KOP94685.1 hypothetical protein AL012_12965 [Citrobacter amalonaticus]
MLTSIAHSVRKNRERKRSRVFYPFVWLNVSFLLRGCFLLKQWINEKKNGNGKNPKIFINSENLRGRRPVTDQIARKDPQKQSKQNVMKFKLNHLLNFKCRNKKASSLEKDDAFIRTGRR